VLIAVEVTIWVGRGGKPETVTIICTSSTVDVCGPPSTGTTEYGIRRRSTPAFSTWRGDKGSELARKTKARVFATTAPQPLRSIATEEFRLDS
jgi:hypothetical protein